MLRQARQASHAPRQRQREPSEVVRLIMRPYGGKRVEYLYDDRYCGYVITKARERRESRRAIATELDVSGNWNCPCCDGHDTAVAALDSVRLPHAAEYLDSWENLTPGLLAWAKRKLKAA